MAGMYRVRTTLAGWQGAPGLLTTYHRASAVPTDAEATVAATRVRAALAVVAPLFAPAVTLQVQSQVDVIEDTNGALIGSQNGGAQAVVPGTAATGVGPAQLAAGLVLSTSQIVHGRRVKGRLFLSPLAAGNTQSVLPPVGVNTAINAFGVALLTASPSTAAQPLLVWSRPVPVGTPSVPVRLGVSAIALSSQVAPKWFSIRSRRD